MVTKECRNVAERPLDGKGRCMRQTIILLPLSAALNVFAFSKVQKCGSFIGFKVGKSTIVIELKLRNVMTEFLEEEIYCGELAIKRTPFSPLISNITLKIFPAFLSLHITYSRDGKNYLFYQRNSC